MKLTALEDQLKCELAAKEESFEKVQELQNENRKMEEMKLLILENKDLQVS